MSFCRGLVAACAVMILLGASRNAVVRAADLPVSALQAAPFESPKPERLTAPSALPQQNSTAWAKLQVGSRVVASIAPPVARPKAAPCVVTLLNHETFGEPGDASSMAAQPHPFRFVWPTACSGAQAGPWAKVVFEADFSVPAGRQYDRTASLWLAGINLYFGTTMEPQPDLAEHWHVERDLTDYSALFRAAARGTLRGQMILNNQISAETSQPIEVTARLLFYPVARGAQAPEVPDHVYSLSASALGEPAVLATSQQSLVGTVRLPQNVERAYLDVIAQSQLMDERWYTCVDQKYLVQTRPYSLEAFEACNGGSLREVEVLVDGRPAGLAPVYPWVFAGGLAPHLWLPTPGIGTLNFIPYRVDLTPFAGLLDDGRPHQIAVRVLGANHFFNVAANLLVDQDHAQAALHGQLLEDTLPLSEPGGLKVVAHLSRGQLGATIGTLTTSLRQRYHLRGVLYTEQGNLVSSVDTSVHFLNQKRFMQPASREYTEQIDQQSLVMSVTSRRLGSRTLARYTEAQSAPFSMLARKSFLPGADRLSQNFTAQVVVRQGRRLTLAGLLAPGERYRAQLVQSLTARDRASGPAISPPLSLEAFDHQQSGQAELRYVDSAGSCLSLWLATKAERIAAVRQGRSCAEHRNVLLDRSRPTEPSLMPLLP